ncbi:sensor histidine kinase [Pseudoduganella albidiflava]|uniref:histidine kinase n=1 Tax=Pseudoduganella albidiflava TaxID=321983 RepID=A0A411X5Y1_9BURK|nr:HAMP domain-containing protein [Pseudoduganella albidiflava]QBI04407.1 HAMP domain-containing protein [Pseudoduganella albidiflava]GGY26997.1 two-component sensor histidine kinase [Pseudoduganella albidiflava]
MARSIRHSLFAALAGFTVLICAVYTGLALVIAYVTEDMLVDRLLERESAAIAAHFHAHGEVRAPAHDFIGIHRGTATLPPEVRVQAAGKARAEIFAGTGRHYHFRALDLQGAHGSQRIYLLADVGPLLVVAKLIEDVGGVVIVVALGLVALALLLAWLLARRLVSPLLELAREVRNVTPEGTVAFSARRRPDEIGYLADKLGTTIAGLHAALRREHAFTRDVSHELRTPLTVMNNVLGQAGPRPLGTEEVAQLRAGLEDIGHTIDVLFALARAEHIARESFDLRGAIEESLLRLVDGGWDSEGLVLDLPDRLDVTGNRHLARLLIDNCLGNARFHGAPGLRIAFGPGAQGGVLSIGNAVEPGRAGTMQGFQHGQDLLRRIATAMGWEIGFHAAAASYRVDIVPLRR